MHSLNRRLWEIIREKKSNLAIAADLTLCHQVLFLADVLGPYICVFKTHVDILTDFTHEFVKELSNLAARHNFLIFEDRKFADIGSTTGLQYSQGIYRISDWAHITNAHPIAGEGTILALKKAVEGSPERGMLVLAEMSSAGSLAKGEYTKAAYEMALKHKDFVLGFIGQRRLDPGNDDDFIYITPGVSLEQSGDSLGQQYRSPEQVVIESGCDVIIVGRSIYAEVRGVNLADESECNELASQVAEKAAKYREAGWVALKKRRLDL